MTTTDDDLSYLSISQIQHGFSAGSLTSLVLTRAFLARIAAHDEHLRCFVRVMAESALAEAKQADVERECGFARGPLHGIPVAIKDLIETKGVVTTSGMPIRADYVPDEDAAVVKRLRNAGAVILGKLAMTEGATLFHHPSIAVPRNPWNPDHDPGFSSSGTGVAVSAGFCVAALGSDTGGSIRIPSAYNGITGLKPTWGRVSRHGSFPLVECLDTIGPMARSAEAAATILRYIAGPDPLDPSAEKVGVPDYLATIRQGVSGVTIGVDWNAIEGDCSADVVRNLRHVAHTLSEEGARFRCVTLPAADLPLMMTVAAAGAAEVHRASYKSRSAEYGPSIRPLLDQGLSASGTDVATAINSINIYRAQLRALFTEVDLVLAPSMTTTAPPIGLIETETMADLNALLRRTAYTMPFNASGSPTITFPTGFAEGLPTSAQIIAPHFDEALLFRAAHSFQSRTDWHLRRPPMYHGAGLKEQPRAT
ncbi:amidase [Sphingobium phenoxybenzoativorans]|uniref:amidase n=1 Tax=Sphingobium phenoxybenzoativorans TaxID=1592790 RepID=UPI0009F706AA|nr:amidase [Sphingobium phenoxybenzoativorans]